MATVSGAPYDKKFFDRIGDSTLRSARIIAPQALELTQATSLVDLGCGQGARGRASKAGGKRQHFEPVVEAQAAHLQPS